MNRNNENFDNNYDKLINRHSVESESTSSDYDYPINTKKTIWNGAKSSPKPLNSRSITNSLNNLNWNTQNQLENTKSLWMLEMEKLKNQNTAESMTNVLDIVVPIIPEKTNSTKKSNEITNVAKSFYYDIPKNIPVNKSMTNLQNISSSSSTLSLSVNNNNHNNNQRPLLPKKSSFIRRRIQANYNDNDYENLPTKNDLASKHNYNTINKLSSLKTVNESTITTVSTKASTLPRPPKPVINLTPIEPETATRKKILNYSHCNDNDDDDDDDYDDDYGYDYVCLESKKKLNNDDERIKLLLSKQYQNQYENLVIQSNTSISSTTTAASSFISNNQSSIKQHYQQHIFRAQRNYCQWCHLAIEIISQTQPNKPEVYFNIVKHILLSGQNLLNTFKLYTTKQPDNHIDNRLNTFSTKFLQELKMIVVRTKRLSLMADNTDNKSIDNLIEHLRLSINISESIRSIFQ